MVLTFGDTRLNARGNWIIERIIAVGSLVLRTIGGNRAGEIGVHRFLDNDRVEAGAIIESAAAKTADISRGRRIVAAQDTTEINFSGRDKGRKGLGPAGDGKALGFFIHPVIAVDADEEAVLGVVAAEVWSRENSEIEKPDRRKRDLSEKESIRWINGAEIAAERLTEAAQVIVVGDRESDIYSAFARKPETIDLIIRAAHNRSVVNGGYVFDQPLIEYGIIEVDVPAKPGQKARKATLQVRAGLVILKRPRHAKQDTDPDQVAINLVETKEIDSPTGVVPLHWRLYTTLPTIDLAHIIDIVRLYRLRWRIEEVFRVLKSDGLKLEETQVEERDRLFKLSALALCAATRILQLTNARDGSPRPATDVIDSEIIDLVARIGKSLEGKTTRQKNPYQVGHLDWVSWIVARLGGWNCYYKPPGPKTMAAGWKRLATMIEGMRLMTQPSNV